ncbi:MAG TPA: hypothetical protein DEB06_05860 [Phycisphaerales bacterium]|nr:hypothetical protein [Phycisphaerales bacterium]
MNTSFTVAALMLTTICAAPREDKEPPMTEFGMTTTGAKRSYEQTIRVRATPEEVWEAIATAEGLVRWFPLEARVKPGVGGSLFTSWRNEYQWDCPITIWDPPARLRNLWGSAETPEAELMGVDWFISREGNETVVRLVHFGIGFGAEWDSMYDGVSRGWEFELENLRRALDERAGRTRHVVYARVNLAGVTREEAWSRVFSGGGLLPASLADASEGQPLDAPLAGGFEMRGSVRRAIRNKDFQASIDNLSCALLRVQIDPCVGSAGDVLTLWVSIWDKDEQFARRLTERAADRLGALFGREQVINPR